MDQENIDNKLGRLMAELGFIREAIERSPQEDPVNNQWPEDYFRQTQELAEMYTLVQKIIEVLPHKTIYRIAADNKMGIVECAQCGLLQQVHWKTGIFYVNNNRFPGCGLCNKKDPWL